METYETLKHTVWECKYHSNFGRWFIIWVESSSRSDFTVLPGRWRPPLAFSPPRQTTLPPCVFFDCFSMSGFSKSIVPQVLTQNALTAVEPLLPRQVFFQS